MSVLIRIITEHLNGSEICRPVALIVSNRSALVGRLLGILMHPNLKRIIDCKDFFCPADCSIMYADRSLLHSKRHTRLRF